MCGGVALAEISFNFDDPGAQGRAVFVSPHQDLPEKLARNLTGFSSEKVPGKRTKRRHAESLVRTDPAHLPWHVGQPPGRPVERSLTMCRGPHRRRGCPYLLGIAQEVRSVWALCCGRRSRWMVNRRMSAPARKRASHAGCQPSL